MPPPNAPTGTETNAATDAQPGAASAEANTKLVIARDAAFRKIVREETGVVSGAAIALSAGNYYWKIDGSTESSWFSINRTGAPRLASPVNTRVTRLEGPLRISFSWSKPVNGELYRIEIYRRSGGADPVVSKTVSQRNVSFEFSEPGEYTWKAITLAGPNQKEFASGEASFVIEDGNLVPPAEIKSGNGKPGETIQATTLAISGKKPVASWDAVPGADAYRVIISSDSEGKNILRGVQTGTNILALDAPLPEGTYYISVSSATKNGVSIPSKPARLDIVTPRPVEPLSPVIDAGTAADKASVTLKWKDESGAESYRVLISTNPDFSASIVEATTTSRTLAATLAETIEGKLYWKVETLDGKGTPAATTGAIAMNVVKKTSAPVPEYPTQGAKIDINATDVFTFKWVASDGAKEYTIALYRMSGDMQTKIGEWKTAGTVFTLDNMEILSFGNFAWDLYADDSKAIRSFFSVYQKTKLSAPKIRTMTTKGEY